MKYQFQYQTKIIVEELKKSKYYDASIVGETTAGGDGCGEVVAERDDQGLFRVSVEIDRVKRRNGNEPGSNSTMVD